MSLSFVSKSVLTATSEGGYEEKPIEGKEEDGGGISRGERAAPLFEQLRANKEQEEQEREEFQKSIMRGTLALDEEDCAHLDALAQEKRERQQLVERETASEMEAFRAAQAVNRMERNMIQDDDEIDDTKKEKETPQKEDPTTITTKKKPAAAKFIPKIIAKKKRKINPSDGQKDDDANNKKSKPKQDEKSTTATATATATTTSTSTNTNSMAGLLAGYGSSSSSDEE